MPPLLPHPFPHKLAPPVGLTAPIGDRRVNAPSDLERIAVALGRLGDYRPWDYGHGPEEPVVWDGALVGALARFQEREGLKVDALALPGGPTERRLAQRLVEQDQRKRRHALPTTPEELRRLRGLGEVERERLLRRAGFSYEPDRLGRLGEGDWRDRNGRGHPPSELQAVLREQLALEDRDSDESGTSSSRPSVSQSRRTRGGQRRTHATKSSGATDRSDAFRRMTSAYEAAISAFDPDILSRTAAETDEELEETYRRRLDILRDHGWHAAAENLERYLNGTGEPKVYSRDEARAFAPIREAEADIRSNVVRKSFTGDVRENWELKERLSSLIDAPDGTSTVVTDVWDGLIRWPEHAMQFVKDGGDFQLAFGDTGVKGLTALRATRRDNRIEFEGIVTYNWNDTYDFEAGKSFAHHMLHLQRTRGAKPYMIDSTWQQRVTGSVDIENGRLVRPRASWRELPEPTGK